MKYSFGGIFFVFLLLSYYFFVLLVIPLTGDLFSGAYRIFKDFDKEE